MVLAAVLACSSQAEPPPSPEPVEHPVTAVVKVEIVPDQPVMVPTLGAEVTLTNARTSLHKDAETGRKYHTSRGTLQFRVGDELDEIAFGPGLSVEWHGRRIAVRGSRGWYELVIQPPAEAEQAD